MNTKKLHLSGEIALLIVLLINSLGVDLMSKSEFGISTISSVPLIFSTAFPVFSFGTWNCIIPDPARPYTDGSEALLLSRLPVLLRSRNRIWKNDRRTQCLAFGTAKHPATEYHLFFLWLSSDVLRHLPRQ